MQKGNLSIEFDRQSKHSNLWPSEAPALQQQHKSQWMASIVIPINSFIHLVSIDYNRVYNFYHQEKEEEEEEEGIRMQKVSLGAHKSLQRNESLMVNGDFNEDSWSFLLLVFLLLFWFFPPRICSVLKGRSVPSSPLLSSRFPRGA